MESAHCPQEIELLKILKELQPIITAALDSLEKEERLTQVSRYLGWSTKFIHFATDSYILLREAGRVHGSKFLIRPILETVIAAGAVANEKGILFQKYYTEMTNANKPFSKDAAREAIAKKEVEELKRIFQQEDPTYPIKCTKLHISEMAKVAKLPDIFYEVGYPIYCEFTHGSLRAVNGKLNEATDPIATSEAYASESSRPRGFREKARNTFYGQMHDGLIYSATAII
jgi:Family of unknown function (DUF5677)